MVCVVVWTYILFGLSYFYLFLLIQFNKISRNFMCQGLPALFQGIFLFTVVILPHLFVSTTLVRAFLSPPFSDKTSFFRLHVYVREHELFMARKLTALHGPACVGSFRPFASSNMLSRNHLKTLVCPLKLPVVSQAYSHCCKCRSNNICLWECCMFLGFLFNLNRRVIFFADTVS